MHFTGDDIENFNRSLNIGEFKGPISIPFNNKALDIWNNIYQSLEVGYSIESLCNASFCLYNLVATFLFPHKHITNNEQSTAEDIISATIIHMKDNIDKKMTVEDMAGQHKLSSSHFSSLFRKATGMPPIDYLST